MHKFKITIYTESDEEYDFVLDLEKDFPRKIRKEKIQYYIKQIEKILMRLSNGVE